MTTAEVWTTIKEYMPIVGLIGLMLGLLNACFGGGWGGRAIGWTFVLGRTRGLAKLKKRRARLQQLHDSDREYYGWLLSGILLVLALFAAQLAFEGVMVSSYRFGAPELQLLGHGAHDFERFVMGIAVCQIPMTRLTDYWSLQRFDRTIARLDHAIAKLEAKMPLQPAPSAV